MPKAGAIPDAAGAEKEAVGTTSHLEGNKRVSRSLLAPDLMGREALSCEEEHRCCSHVPKPDLAVPSKCCSSSSVTWGKAMHSHVGSKLVT